MCRPFYHIQLPTLTQPVGGSVGCATWKSMEIGRNTGKTGTSFTVIGWPPPVENTGSGVVYHGSTSVGSWQGPGSQPGRALSCRGRGL